MKTARVAHLRWHGGHHTRVTVESSPHRFRVGETIEVVFADVAVTGFVLSAVRCADARLSQQPRAEYTIQVAVEAEGDAEACICLPHSMEPSCSAVHAASVDLDDTELYFGEKPDGTA